MTVTYEDVVKLAEQLSEDEQNRLIVHLCAFQTTQKAFPVSASLPPDPRPTRQQLIEELESLQASGAFDQVESLYGKYANPTVPSMSEEAFHAQLHDVATEWEQELDEFFNTED